MTLRQRLEVRAAEIRQRLGELADLEGEARTDDIEVEQRGLLREMQALQGRLAAAITAEDTDASLRDGQGQADGEGAERRAMIERCNVGNIFSAALEHRATSGPERELQDALGLGGNQIPIALLRGAEHRARTPAPDNVGTTQNEIIEAVFPMACAAWLGVDQPMVAVGDATFPVVTTSATPQRLTKGQTADESTGAFAAELLQPTRLQASFRYSREDRARFAMMDMALRNNLSLALSDLLDKEILVGADGLLGGTNLTQVAATGAWTFTHYRAAVFGNVDGTFSGSAMDMRVVMGAQTYGHAAAQYVSLGSNLSGLEAIDSPITGGVKVSAHVPRAASNQQDLILRLGMRRDMISPIWEGVTLIPDEITDADKGEIIVTAVLLFAAKILRSGGFKRIQTQHQ